MDNWLLDLAIDHARSNTQCGHLPRMAALLVFHGGHHVFVGYNKLKTHPMQAKFSRRPGSIYLHAEVDAIVNVVRQGSGYMLSRENNSTMYVARVLKNGQPALAKPCPGCQRAIMHFGIANVEWTT